jgi:hypothetical protein
MPPRRTKQMLENRLTLIRKSKKERKKNTEKVVIERKKKSFSISTTQDEEENPLREREELLRKVQTICYVCQWCSITVKIEN